MSTYTQYADHSFYFANALDMGRTDDNGYLPHETLDRDTLLANHENADEIMSIMRDVYRAEDTPSNGSTEGFIKGKLTHSPDTRDLAEQAHNPPQYWTGMMLAYQQNIRKLARWIGGFNPDTKHDVQFKAKLARTKAKMKSSPVYRVKLEKRWQLLKMCNKSL